MKIVVSLEIVQLCFAWCFPTPEKCLVWCKSAVRGNRDVMRAASHGAAFVICFGLVIQLILVGEELGKPPGSLEECGEDPCAGHLKVCVSMETEGLTERYYRILKDPPLDSRGVKPGGGEDLAAPLLRVCCLAWRDAPSLPSALQRLR